MKMLSTFRRWLRRTWAPDNDRWYGAYVAPTKAGVAVNETSAMQCAAVYSCVRVLADGVASLPLHLYRRLPDGGKERATDHPLYNVLHGLVNPETTAFRFFQFGESALATWGNAYAYKERNRLGEIIGLWPLRPDRVTVSRPAVGAPLVYEYRDGAGVGRKYGADEILHVPGFGFDGVVGTSVIGLARESIALGLAAEEFGARFFSNDARPGGVLEHPAKLNQEAHDRLKKSWAEMHQGASKSHKVAILEEGMKFHEVGIPPEDAQFLETRKFQVEEICRIFRVMPIMVGYSDKASTYASAEQMFLAHVVHTLRPWLVLWEQELSRSLLKPEERSTLFFEFLVDGMLRGDIKSRYQAYAIGRDKGWLSANDIRAMENMNPIENGDIYLVPLNMTTADKIEEEPAAGNQGGTQ